MTRICIVLLVLALAGCAAAPVQLHEPSPCAASEASYECQVERYNNVNVE